MKTQTLPESEIQVSNTVKGIQVQNDPNDTQESEALLFQNRLLLNLTKNESIDNGEIEESLKCITEAAAMGLDTERASVWLYNSDRSAIRCVDLFEKSANQHTGGIELKAQDFPAYFKYLAEERTLPAHDAHTDPSTFEFSAVYLKPLNIFSMLDAPIRKNGQTIGVVCCEKVGQFRKWSLTDEVYAGSIADLISRVFVARDRTNALQSLKIMNENLENLVNERTQQLEAQRASVIQAAKMASLGEMSAGIAHEINSPLTTIQLLAEQLMSMAHDGDLNSERVAKFAGTIETTAVRIGKIIQSLRTFSRDVQKDPFLKTNLRGIIAETLTFCEQRFNLTEVKIEISEIPEDLEVECRSVQIQQVILNLLNNAYDALSNHKNDKWIRIRAWQKSNMVHISVTDSGLGIPKELREKIMQPFFTTKEKGKGTGLGLSVSTGIIQSHNGVLSINSACQNTCFEISMPMSQPN